MRLSGAGTDSFTDIGIDTQYQYLGDPHAVTVRAAWIHENHNTSASQTLGLADNLLSLILPAYATAFGTFLMRQYFMQIPKDYDEAGLIDGGPGD